MALIKILNTLDFQLNQAKNFVLESVAAGANAVSAPSGTAGRVIYNTSDGYPYNYNAATSAWQNTVLGPNQGTGFQQLATPVTLGYIGWNYPTTTPVEFNWQRATWLADPINPADAVTLNYFNTNAVSAAYLTNNFYTKEYSTPILGQHGGQAQQSVTPFYTVNHNLGDQYPVVQVWETAVAGSQVFPDIQQVDTNTSVLVFAATPLNGQYQITAQGK